MIYMFLANGFEEVEALFPLDLLRRAGLDVRTVGVGSQTLTGAHGITVLADLGEQDVVWEGLEMVILPGGMPGTNHLQACPTVQKAIDEALARDAYLAAICAAPKILGERGLLKGKHATCFPGFEACLEGALLSPDKVVCDGKLVTAAGMGVAKEFGLTLVALLTDEDTAQNIDRAIQSAQ